MTPILRSPNSLWGWYRLISPEHGLIFGLVSPEHGLIFETIQISLWPILVGFPWTWLDFWNHPNLSVASTGWYTSSEPISNIFTFLEDNRIYLVSRFVWILKIKDPFLGKNVQNCGVVALFMRNNASMELFFMFENIENWLFYDQKTKTLFFWVLGFRP